MKKFALLMIFVSLLLTLPFEVQGRAAAEDTPTLCYGLITSETALCSDSLLTRPITTLPETYFVVILATDALYLLVSYIDLEGYVSPTAIQIVDYEPVTKFATVFRYTVNNDGYPATLRSLPDHLSGQKLAEVPHAASGAYYGTALGSAIIAEVGNLWYFVKYGEQNGYIYKSQIKVDPIEPNKIQKVEPIAPTPPPKSPFELENKWTILIILALSLPAVIIMLLIFRGKREGRFW